MAKLLNDSNIPFIVQRMNVQDIPQVMAIEKDSFLTPWPATAYRHELVQNENSHYFVARKREAPRTSQKDSWLEQCLRKLKPHRPPVLGYSGFWILGEEAHISTIAVRPNYRGRGIGELLLSTMIELACALKTTIITLEVRVSNRVAQNLYAKYRFEKTGRRRRYYRDNNEDALSMSTPPLDDPLFVESYHRNLAALYTRLLVANSKGEKHGSYQIRAQL